MNTTKKHKMLLILPLCLGLPLLLFAVIGLINPLTVRRYQLETDQAEGHLRIVFITDLHDSRYGQDMEKLAEAIRAEAPDLVLIGGDFFSDEEDSPHTEALLKIISGLYPCYYVSGNHECRASEALASARLSLLQMSGVRVLSGEALTLDVNGFRFNLCGVDDPLASDRSFFGEESSYAGFYEQLRFVASVSENGLFTLLFSHRPETFDYYASLGFDLVLAGHAHGGQWRIPGLINGVYAPNQGLFPAYAGGLYQKDGTQMIVSRGLARGTYIVPRFYNRPELVTVDIQGTK